LVLLLLVLLLGVCCNQRCDGPISSSRMGTGQHQLLVGLPIKWCCSRCKTTMWLLLLLLVVGLLYMR
jgi:hypothetical protein